MSTVKLDTVLVDAINEKIQGTQDSLQSYVRDLLYTHVGLDRKKSESKSRTEKRNLMMFQLYMKGQTANAIGEVFGVSARTVYRIVSEQQR